MVLQLVAVDVGNRYRILAIDAAVAIFFCTRNALSYPRRLCAICTLNTPFFCWQNHHLNTTWEIALVICAPKLAIISSTTVLFASLTLISNVLFQVEVPPCIFEADNQGHQFFCLLKSIPLNFSSFTCNFCGTEGYESPYLCTLCKLMFHKDCILLPHTIAIRQHPHHMTHTYFPRENESGMPCCGVCQIQLKSGHGAYNCKDCNFFAHVKCAREYVTELFKTETANNESRDSSTCTARKVKHFSHHHSLILIDEDKINASCGGCMLPMSTPCYGCLRCNFFLHKACVELPEQLQLQCGPYSGILSARANTVDGVFYCALCRQYCHGFIYNTDRFGFAFDVRCGINFSAGTITHESHEHPLFLSEGGEGRRGCSACSNDRLLYLFRCGICDFTLDFRCANLPHEARHEYDEHPLLLTYIDPNTYQCVCQVCEKDRDPKLWFYRCEECDFDAHPECVLGKNPFVKLGNAKLYDIHTHPLALVEKTEDHPLCHPQCNVCHKPCNNLAYECIDSECNFIIHRKGKCWSTSVIQNRQSPELPDI